MVTLKELKDEEMKADAQNDRGEDFVLCPICGQEHLTTYDCQNEEG